MLNFSWVRKIGNKRLFILCLSIAVITTLSLVIFIAFSNTTVNLNDSSDDGGDDDGGDDDDCFWHRIYGSNLMEDSFLYKKNSVDNHNFDIDLKNIKSYLYDSYK